ncbi:MAG: PEP/pyruvate-binding domain-containing protein, partial [Verrucomicrobiae bacterium]|nr:PEP/pyruvate-binding domain-containing protein [Verrucomicrobiae bacterium]
MVQNTDEQPRLSTGLKGLDRVLTGLLPGDNVVWAIKGIEDYRPVVSSLVAEAGRLQKPLIYFRFADHPALMTEESGAVLHQLHPEEGFERFVTEILDVIERAGIGAYYVFDCLSDLAAEWFSDRMLGNFFLIVCPYLYELKTIAYFALEKHLHSFHATRPIFDTAQVIIEVHRKGHSLFLHPLKVWQRHTPTLYMLHKWEGEELIPVTSSALTTDILSSVPTPWLEFTVHRPGIWVRTFHDAQHTLTQIRNGQRPARDPDALFSRLVKMVVTRDERFHPLVMKFLDLGDVVGIMQRMIGTGLIGGKSLGMILARGILTKTDPKWAQVLEAHDSFFIGSDVFYTYLVQNGCWWLRRRHKDFKTLLERAAQAREKIMQGKFPDYIQEQFMEMLEYFGQSPLIVRSSSLLEDSYGNSFSGKYESVFCANQGSPQERLSAFMDAVRTVYASTMSEESLHYRRTYGLLDQDEQMALLVQRVSGQLHGHLFFPDIAGVGFSFNPFVWSEEIDPNAGVVRMVFGLGTRAVDRTDDDYTRLVALNAPNKRPEATPDQIREFAQRQVDVLDLEKNRLVSKPFDEVVQVVKTPVLEYVLSPDENGPEQQLRSKSESAFPGFLNFDRLLRETHLVPTLRDLFKTLHEHYKCPVDVEFTANFDNDGSFKINLLQCRPFQVKMGGQKFTAAVPKRLPPESIVLATRGPIVGRSMVANIDTLIYAVSYTHL